MRIQDGGGSHTIASCSLNCCCCLRSCWNSPRRGRSLDKSKISCAHETGVEEGFRVFQATGGWEGQCKKPWDGGNFLVQKTTRSAQMLICDWQLSVHPRGGLAQLVAAWSLKAGGALGQ